MRIAAYYRLSKKDQATEEAKESQEFQLKLAAKEAGADPKDLLIFSDIMSGRRNDRPGFIQLQQAVRSGRVEAVIVRMDRMSRDAAIYFDLYKLFESTKCKVWDLLRGRFLDFSNPDDWEDYHKAGIAAEKESRVISKRIKLRNEYNRAKGRPHAGKAPLGYRRNKTGFFEPNPETWMKAYRRVELFLELRSTVLAAREAGKEEGKMFSYQTLVRWLSSQTLRGHTPHLFGERNTKGKGRNPSKIIWNTHYPLLSPEGFKDDPNFPTIPASHVDSLMAISWRRRGAYSGTLLYPLSGKFRCARCGGGCHITGSKPGYVYCAAHRRGEGCGGDVKPGPKGKSGSFGTLYPVAEKAVIEACIQRGKEIAKEVPDIQTTVSEKPEVLALRDLIKRYQLMANDDPDMLPVLNKKKAELNAMLEMDSINPKAETLRNKLSLYARIPSFWEEATPEEKQVLWQDLIKTVEVAGQFIKVNFVI